MNDTYFVPQPEVLPSARGGPRDPHPQPPLSARLSARSSNQPRAPGAMSARRANGLGSARGPPPPAMCHPVGSMATTGGMSARSLGKTSKPPPQPPTTGRRQPLSSRR
jgi:hypothetical protein